MNEQKTKVLTNWQPSILSENVIRKEFFDLMSRLELYVPQYYDIEVRNPVFNLQIQLSVDRTATHWHRDDNGLDALYVMWSNINPTEVRFSATGEHLKCSDGDVILLQNKETMHKFPSEVTGSRWFVRVSGVREL